MNGPIRKRFWDKAHVVPDEDGFGVLLDQRPVRLPGGALLHVPGRRLADAVALEWDLAGGEKGSVFGVDELMLTALAGTLQEHVVPMPGRSVELLLGYAAGELLCYRAAYPDELVALQASAWDPWLEWLASAYEARLAVGHGIMPVQQSPPVLAALRLAVGGLSPACLAGLGVIVPALGSLVLGLAMAAGQLDPPEAMRLARLDEEFQATNWGRDREVELRASRLLTEISMARRFMELADG